MIRMNKLLPLLLIILITGAGGYYFLNKQKLISLDPDSSSPVPSASANSSAFPQSEKIIITGTMICLPHKNSSGPQTMECAFGLKGDDGNNYALTDPEWKYLTGVSFDKKIEVRGKLTKKQDQKYESAGVIEIESLVTGP